jgi:DNA-binding LacI/PurR family transcriptional regulator
MATPRFSTITEQVAAHLRNEVLSGRWRGMMPGRNQLTEELGVSPRTVELAFELLEKEGVLAAQGTGRRRVISAADVEIRPPLLRVALLMGDHASRLPNILHHLLDRAGHRSFFPSKTLFDLDMDVRRVARLVREVRADAWIVGAGSRAILEWFAEQPTPAFALFGHRYGLPIAGVGPDKAPVMAEAARHLIHLGHRRISLIHRRSLRLPQPTPILRAFLDELEAAKIITGVFNLPEWEESGPGFERILNSLFAHTPPTALILDEPFQYHAAYHQITRRGLRVPEDVSLVCTDDHPTFAWCRPTVAHFFWDYRPVVRRAVRWANNIALGKEDRRQSGTKAKFVAGGTIGPAPMR